MCIVPFELVKKMYGFHDGETSGGQYRGFLRPLRLEDSEYKNKL